MKEFWNSRPIRKLRRDPWAVACLCIIVSYALIALLVGLGAFGDSYMERVGEKYSGPSFNDWHWQSWLGTDRQGRSILARTLYSVKIAFMVGFVSAGVGVVVGGLLGSMAGYFGKWVDAFIVWLYSTLQSIPSLLLLMMITAAAGRGLLGIYLAFGATFWVGPCRVVRGEVLKLREAEYVQAAKAMGYGHAKILLKHIIPNTMHLLLVNFALLFVGAIKSEVILSFLGFGVLGEPSWGIMISQSTGELVSGFYWQLGAASVAMFGLVLSFNIFADAMQDALDPKAL